MLRKFRRGRIWYVRGSVRGQDIYESTGTADEQRAESFRVRREGEIWDGRVHGKRASVNFAEALIVYQNGKDIAWQDASNLTRLLDYFGRWKLKDINQTALDGFISRHFANVKPATIARHAISPLCSVMRAAAKRGWCDSPKFEWPKKPPGRVRWITRDEATVLLSNCAPHLRPLVTFLLNTGARLGEATGLEWREVDLTARRVTFLDTKNGTNRGVPLNDTAFLALANLEHRDGRVFRTHTGEPFKITKFHAGNIARGFQAACRASGIKNFRPHDCRHTFASWAVMAGVPLRTLAELLGHKSLEMVLRYSHLSTDHLKDAVDKIDRAQSVQSPSAPAKTANKSTA